MNAKAKEPDRRLGGTFIRDKDGNLLEHIPPTKSREQLVAEAQAKAAADASKKKGKE